MTPLLQFRIWWRRATFGQQVTGAVAAVMAAALLVWTAVPSPTTDRSSVAVTGSNGAVPASGPGASGPGVPVAQAASTGAGAPTAGAAAGGTASAATPVAAGSSGAPQVGGALAGGSAASRASAGPATAATACTKRGTLKVGVVVPEGAGGSLNAVIGNPPTSEEEADYAAVLDSVNKAGGVDCNSLVGDYVTADLTNPSGAQAGCLQFQQDKVFAVLAGFLPTFTDDCTLQAHIPTIGELAIPASQVKKYYPYYLASYPTYEILYKNFVNAADQMGYFGPSKQFAKLGIFYKDCLPDVNQELLNYLAAVGVSGPKVDRFDLGCSSSFAAASAIQQGVLQFKTDGVTTVTVDNDLADIQNISNVANAEQFHPAGGWVLPDDGVAAITASANFHPNASEFDGALAITAGQYGGIESHVPETPGTLACDKVMTSHNLPTVYQSGDQYAGSTCTLVWMLAAAIEHGGVDQAALVAGLQAAKSVQASFPNGPNDFSAPGTTTGGQFWRPITYHGSCQCWNVDNPNWTPSFP